MISLEDINNVLNNTFFKSSLKDLQVYLKKFSWCKTWWIASDYCLDDKQKANDVIAISIMPYINTPDSICNYIQKHISCDIKHSKIIPHEAIDFLRNNDFIFNIAFIIDKKKHVFSSPDHTRLENIRACLAKTIQELKSQPDYIEELRNFKKFEQKAKSSNFNVKLFENTYLISYLIAYISNILVLSAGATKLCWFSDRDAIIDMKPNITPLLYTLNVYGLLNKNKYPFNCLNEFLLAMAKESNDNLWFDEIVRIPDYVAGTLASWNIKINRVDKAKHKKMLEGVFSDNFRIAIINISISKDSLIQASRIMISKSPFL